MTAPVKGRLEQAMTDLADTLAAAGVPAALKAGEVQVPGAWISARELAVSTLGGGWRVTVHVWLVIADTEETEALAAFDPLLEAALGVLPVDTTGGDTVQLAGTLVLRSDEGPLPAVQITTTIDI
jgi:hypothetical protein